MDFTALSYQKHAENFAASLTAPDRIRIAESWFDESSADFWRHSRAYECADLLLPEEAASSWLTVGDGRWGLDSLRIKKKGYARTLPTDISPHLLKAAEERGLISAYALENAEALSFADASFDYVFCKESLHHFPRPWLALYEMLRVAGRGVFLIEPNDPVGIRCSALSPIWGFRQALRLTLALFIRRIRGHRTNAAHHPPVRHRLFHGKPGWESAGNYVYGFSRREYEKAALALNLPQLAVKGLNDHYVQGCEFEPADEAESAVFKTIVETVRNLDAACAAGESEYNLLMCGIMKRPLAQTVKARFAAAGWEVSDLPANPNIPAEA